MRPPDTRLKERPKNMRTFLTIWSGQVISMIGSGLTRFALGVWIYAQTGQATPFALAILFGTLPGILLAPIAGVVADRWNRRRVMILADSGAALATAFAAAIIFFGDLQIWHIYLVALFSSIFSAFQEPAYMASVAMLVPKKELGRANGMLQAGQAIEMLVSPLLAGMLFGVIGLTGIILIDFATFFFAVGALLLVHIPQPEATESDGKEKSSYFEDIIFGWKYLTARTGLLSMLIYFAFINFFINMGGVLTVPLVLSFAGVTTMGIVQMVGGVGMLAGSIAMSAWGGLQRKMTGVYAFIALFGAAFILVGFRPSATLIGLGMFLMLACVPLAAGSSQVIWQSKVALGVQGRVFAIRGMISRIMMPVAFLLAGPLADRVFGPLMIEGGVLADSVGQVIGVGQGRGIGLMYILIGGLVIVTTAIAYAYPRMRLVEDELPDVIPDDPTEEDEADVNIETHKTDEKSPAEAEPQRQTLKDHASST